MREIIKSILLEYRENIDKNGVYDDYGTSNDDQKIVNDLYEKVKEKLRIAYKEVTGMDLDLPKIVVKIDPNIKKGKIAGFNHPDENNNHGVLGIKPKALGNMDYLEDIITHELIHASVGEDLPDHKEHSGIFQKLADKLNLPEYRRD